MERQQLQRKERKLQDLVSELASLVSESGNILPQPFVISFKKELATLRSVKFPLSQPWRERGGSAETVGVEDAEMEPGWTGDG